MTTDIYIATTHFKSIAEAIAALKPCPFFGVVTPDQVMMTLAEFGVLPEIIRADVERVARIDAEIEARKLSDAISKPVANEQLAPFSAPAKTLLLN
ncbi:hypothetical protein FNL55_12300 [Tardiphaga sp. vice352]|uniref:hypothetical protein n=1 Tax=unclassified Tardiphaga TaxID=2631404 RepID=UPI0011625FD8|nr:MULTISPECIES: hypothetical protein [unclassified Tardiphaga]MBC7623388.1 hypothetical protein [Burkholderiales bacterium]QDM16748.1 hypothetical protein FNL53_13015 [Tardiphaga sp. vice278]QDM32022.1 hypothetical protein FNL55_12300 [Tardiphaga sp. vice352]